MNLLIMGKQEWDRSVSFDVYERERNKDLPELPIFATAEEEIEVERIDEESIRNFLKEKEILTIPDWVKHYIFQKIPAHFTPFAHMGVNDDLTSETRLE